MRKLGWWVVLRSHGGELDRIFVEEYEGPDELRNDNNLRQAVIDITKDGLTSGDTISVEEGESE